MKDVLDMQAGVRDEVIGMATRVSARKSGLKKGVVRGP